MRHYTAGAPLEAGKPVTVQAGKAAKSTLWPAEGGYPAEHPSGDPEHPDQAHPSAGKPYPKGQPFDLVPARDFREGEVVPEEELMSQADYDEGQRQVLQEHNRELAMRTGRRPPPRERTPSTEVDR